MKKYKGVSILLGLLLILSVFATPILAQDDNVQRPDDWAEESHSNSADLNYDVVFPQDAVNTITITIEPEEWQAMLDDMTGLYGEFGTSNRGEPGDNMEQRGLPPELEGLELPEGVDMMTFMQMLRDGELPEGFELPDGFVLPQLDGPGGRPDGAGGPGGGPGGMTGDSENPIWVAVDIELNGEVWTNVGMRFKGNSSLRGTWGDGNYKLPFKLDFDEFEDDYPEIDNQRFYGFKQLSFSSNWSDDSLLREKVTADIFREAGVPASQTAFYAVYVDYGEGPLYFGLYTAVEIVDDTVIETQFADDSGNVYKPEGTGATFAAGSFDEESFDKETNKKEDDYSDILALYDALHADSRTTDPEVWCSDLEAVLDVDEFLRWLAVNQVAQNWDTYGQMSHNYYLYTDPTTGLITWIPWDNNMALSEHGGMGGGEQRARNSGMPGGNTPDNSEMPAGMPGGGPGGKDGSLSIDLDSVDDSWPLIRYLLDDPVYHDLYVTYVAETINGAFEPTQIAATYQELHDLIAPYVVGENGENEGYTNLSSPGAFDTALVELIEHASERYTVAQGYLTEQAVAQ